ncbi:radical SAM protein [bacterium]|nr:radical SAM protein [bacterium]
MFLSSYNSLIGFVKRHFGTLVPFLTPRRILNVIVAVFEMKARKIVCRCRPFMIRVDPSSRCNLRCPACDVYKTKTREKRMMDLGDFEHVVDKIRDYALRISLYEMGEPLLNRDIYKMIAYASDRKISTLISTNFNLFKREHLDDLFKSRLTILEPCLDGFSQEKYEIYRRGGDVEAVKNGIQMVMEHKRKIRARWPIVDVQVINFDHIMDEIPLIDRFLKACRVDKITYRQENYGFNSPETTSLNNTTPSPNACFWLYFSMTVRPDGNVYPCCGRGFDRMPYGNILTQDPAEIWNNKYYRFSRALYSKGPDLELEDDMRDIPCLTCQDYRKLRNVIRPAGKAGEKDKNHK